MARSRGKKKDVVLSRGQLAHMDHDTSLKRIAQGSLPAWCRGWAREKLPAKLALIDAKALPWLYTRHGDRLPKSMSVGLIRALSDKKKASEYVELCQGYVHEVALARFADHVLSQWSRVMAKPETTSLAQHQYAWVPMIHVYFGDLYGVERAMSEAVLPSSKTPLARVPSDAVHHQAALSDHPLTALCASLRDGVAPGAALLVLLAHGERDNDWLMGILSTVLGRDEHFKKVRARGRYWWSHWTHSTELTGMSLDDLSEIACDLGFAGESRAYVLDGSQQWIGGELFERFIGDDEDVGSLPEPGAHSTCSFHVAVWTFSQLFAQTGEAFERAASARTMWDAVSWREQFLDDRYFAFWAQRVLWGRVIDDGDGLEVFRVCEDLSLADQEDETFFLSPDDRIVVTEGDALSEQDRVRWSEVLSSYEVITAFKQL